MMAPTLVESTWSSSYLYAFVVGLVLGYLPGTSWWNVPICGLALIVYDALFKTWRYRMNRKEYGYTLPKILLVGTLSYSIFAFVGYAGGLVVRHVIA